MSETEEQSERGRKGTGVENSFTLTSGTQQVLEIAHLVLPHQFWSEEDAVLFTRIEAR